MSLAAKRPDHQLSLYRGPDDAGPPRDQRQLTLSDVLELYWLPRVRGPARSAEATLEKEASDVHLFDAVMNGPPVEQIDEDTWAEFGRRLELIAWRHRPLSEHSIHSICVHVAQLIRYLFPSTGKRPGLGILPAFYLAIPTARRDPPEDDYSLAELDRLLQVAATNPTASKHFAGVEPSVWWTAFLLVAYNTGWRPITIFGVTWEHVKASRHEGWILVPPEALKLKRKPEEFYLNLPARDALAAIGRTTGPLVPWTGSWRKTKSLFYRLFRRMEARAGIEPKRNQKLKRIRRATLTHVTAQDYAAGKLVAGHTMGDVLLNHYVNRFTTVPPVLDRLPQPGKLQQRNLF